MDITLAQHPTTTSLPQMGHIRTVIFLIAGLCAGLPALVWAVRSLHQLQPGNGRVSIFIVSLIFSDALELLLIPFLVAGVLEWVRVPALLLYAFLAARLCGFYFHQLVALGGLLSLRYPLCASLFSSRLISSIISIVLWTCAIILFFYKGLTFLMFLFGLACVVAIITCCLACKTSGSVSYIGMNPVLYVIIIALVTLAVLYVPFMSVHCTCIFAFGPGCFESPPWIMTLSIMSMRLITDPLLCVLVRKIPMATTTHTKRQPDEGSAWLSIQLSYSWSVHYHWQEENKIEM